MKFREQFEPDRGFRFYRRKQSVLIHAWALGSHLEPDQRATYVSAITRFHDAVAKRDGMAPQRPQPALTRQRFPEVGDAPFFKYVSDETWRYVREGSFQFGSAGYYRTTERKESRDEREGYCTIHLTSAKHELHVTLTSGFNCAIFCGTACRNSSNDSHMRLQFGEKLIKISSPKAFGQRACRLLGAKRFHVYDVIYTDLKDYSAEHDGIDRLYEITKGGDLNDLSLKEINKRFFGRFYEYGFAPSLFSKPEHYASELERRIVLEFDADLKSPTLRVSDAGLREMVELIE